MERWVSGLNQSFAKWPYVETCAEGSNPSLSAIIYMKKKNCIITGGTSGLGLSLVEKFVNNGFFVHILAKDSKKIKSFFFHKY